MTTTTTTTTALLSSRMTSSCSDIGPSRRRNACATGRGGGKRAMRRERAYNASTTSRAQQKERLSVVTSLNSTVAKRADAMTAFRTHASASEEPKAARKELYKFWEDSERLSILSLWLALFAVATFVAPKTAGSFDTDLITQLVSSPFQGQVNPLFEALFNSLGVIPAVYASLLLPGGGEKQPKLQPKFFVGASFVLGFFALGPYLIARTPVLNGVKKSDLGFFTKNILESKVNALFLTAFSGFLYYWAFSHLLDVSVVSEFVTLLTKQSTLACVSTCDLIILSLVMKTAIQEDLQRRSSSSPEVKPLFYLLPVLGPSLYLLTRPELEE